MLCSVYTAGIQNSQEYIKQVYFKYLNYGLAVEYSLLIKWQGTNTIGIDLVREALWGVVQADKTGER